MMEDKKKEEEIRQQVIDDIIKYLQGKGEEIRTSGKPIKDQMIQMDVILDVVRFLDKYKENVQVLNNHLYNKSNFEK